MYVCRSPRPSIFCPRNEVIEALDYKLKLVYTEHSKWELPNLRQQEFWRQYLCFGKLLTLLSWKVYGKILSGGLNAEWGQRLGRKASRLYIKVKSKGSWKGLRSEVQVCVMMTSWHRCAFEVDTATEGCTGLFRREVQGEGLYEEVMSYQVHVT